MQTSENLAAHGLIDAVLPPERLADIASRALTVLTAPRRSSPPPADDEPAQPEVGAWESVTITRRLSPTRAFVSLLRYAATDVVPLNGTGEGEQQEGLALVLARFSGGAVRPARPGSALAGQSRPAGPGRIAGGQARACGSLPSWPCRWSR